MFRRKYSVDALTDATTADFGCPRLSSQSKKKKDKVIEVDKLIVFFLYAMSYSFVNTGFLDKLFLLILGISVKFFFSEIRDNKTKICLDCKETHFNWFF